MPMIPTQRIGDFFEIATARITLGKVIGGDRNNGPYCPDVRINDKSYAESKSCGESGRVIIYEQRVRRETEWCQDKFVSLHYFIWKHNVTLDKSIRTLRHDLAKQTKQLLVISHEKLFSLTRLRPSKCINKRNPAAYQQGWFINYTAVQKLCPTTMRREVDLGKYQLDVIVSTDNTEPTLYASSFQKMAGTVITDEKGHLQLRRKSVPDPMASNSDKMVGGISTQIPTV